MKGTLKRLLLVLAGLSFVVYSNFNLDNYVAYYVGRLLHEEGTRPELALIIDYIEWMEEADDGISKIYDCIIYRPQSQTERPMALMKGFSGDDFHYELFVSSTNETISYRYTDEGCDYSYDLESMDISQTNQQVFKKGDLYLDEILQPIIKKNSQKPLINLQWLFNLKHYFRFNPTQRAKFCFWERLLEML